MNKCFTKKYLLKLEIKNKIEIITVLDTVLLKNKNWLSKLVTSMRKFLGVI